MTPVRLEPAALQSRVKHSTIEPLGSNKCFIVIKLFYHFTGLHYLTIGQRANISGQAVAMFVAKKDIQTNELIVVSNCSYLFTLTF